MLVLFLDCVLNDESECEVGRAFHIYNTRMKSMVRLSQRSKQRTRSWNAQMACHLGCSPLWLCKTSVNNADLNGKVQPSFFSIFLIGLIFI